MVFKLKIDWNLKRSSNSITNYLHASPLQVLLACQCNLMTMKNIIFNLLRFATRNSINLKNSYFHFIFYMLKENLLDKFILKFFIREMEGNWKKLIAIIWSFKTRLQFNPKKNFWNKIFGMNMIKNSCKLSQKNYENWVDIEFSGTPWIIALILIFWSISLRCLHWLETVIKAFAPSHTLLEPHSHILR